LAIAHVQGKTVIVDAVRERRAPFSPDGVVEEFAATLKAYGIGQVVGDRYGSEWPRERFRVHGVEYRVADKIKSDLYLALLPLLNSSRVELLDHPRLVNQLIGLERRTSRAGKDSIDHQPGAHDDVCNAVAGAAVLAAEAAAQPRAPFVSPTFYSKQAGFFGGGAENATNKSATAKFYEYYGGLGGVGSPWPGSGVKDW